MAASTVEKLQEQLQHELELFRAKEKELQRVVTMRGSLEAQLTENSVVQGELDLVKEEAEVFKLIGPVLMKVEIPEAKDNVLKRITYIKAELKRCEEQLASLTQKQNEHRMALTGLQKSLQEAHKTTA